MASTTTIGEVKVGTSIVTGEFVQSIDEEMNELPGEISPLVTYFGYSSPVTLDEQWRHQWVRNERMDARFSITSNMTNSVTALTIGTYMSAADAALLQVGAVFIILPQFGSGQTEEHVRVTANDGTTVTVVRDYDNKNSGTGYAHTSGDQCYILLPSYLDTDSFPESPRRKGEFVFNYAIQAMWEWSMTDYATARQSYLQDKQAQLMRDVKNGRELALKQLNNAIIYGVKRQPTGTVQPYFDGLRSLITTNVRTVTNNVLTPTDIEEVLDDIKGKDATVNGLTMMGTRNSRRILNAVLRGYYNMELAPDAKTAPLNSITAMQTDLGLVEFMEVPQVPEGELILISNKSDVQLCPVKVDGLGTGWVDFTRGAKETNSRKEQHALSWIGTLKIGHEQRHARIKGFSPTVSAYGGSV